MKKIKSMFAALFSWVRRRVRGMMRRSGKAEAAKTAGINVQTATPETTESPKTTVPPEATGTPGSTPVKAAAAPARRSPDGGLSANRANIIRFNEQFLNNHYMLRRNVLKGVTEFRPIASGEDGEAVATELPWQPLTERDLNRLTVEQLKAGGESWSYGMKLCTDSSAIADFHPVRHYLASLPAWDGHDHIGDMARRVPTDYGLWPAYFHRWLLALTAQALGMGGHGNSIVPMLIGAQGTRKTTFCRSILPPVLREYFMDDIKMDNAEQVERVMGRMWLVCIDEYDSKTPREQAKIKRLLTEKDVQVRRMRSDQYTMTERLASFIATTNDDTPLPGGDGTRRYLCVGVSGSIDTGGDINHDQMFAQAVHELRQEGCLYWFTDDDEREIQEHNRPYQQLTSVESLLPSLFEPAERKRENLWQVIDIKRELAKTLKGADVPSLRALGLAIRTLHWPRGGINGMRGYYLKVKE